MTDRDICWFKNPPPDAAAEDRRDVALALVLWRYVDHTAACTMADETRRDRAVELAKRLGIWQEFWEAIQAVDVLQIKVKNLDAPPVKHGGRKKKVKEAVTA